jgi:hypothetical protein
MYSGASTRDCMESGKREMVSYIDKAIQDQDPKWRHLEDTLGKPFLRNAQPLCYDFSDFERTNGRIVNTESDIELQRSLGPCAKKLHNNPSETCAGND